MITLSFCYKYHIPITLKAYTLCVKLYVLNSYLGGILPIHENIFILKNTMLCLHTHTYKHTTRTCTNVSLVYYSQNNVMNIFILYIYCVEKYINFHGLQSSNIAWIHYFPLPLIFSLLSYLFVFLLFTLFPSSTRFSSSTFKKAFPCPF